MGLFAWYDSRKVLSLTDFDLSIWTAIGLSVLFALTLLSSYLHYRALLEIRPLKAGVRTQPLDCMVVIPARNEQGKVGRAVGSLPPDSVIVVDDFSRDETAAEARRAGAGVLAAQEPLEGALGKPSACMEGARVLTSRWILFADADTRYEAGFLDAAVAAAEAGKRDFLSIYLRPEYRTLAESALSPFAVALYFCGINPRADAGLAFNGQCVLVRRDPYEFVGGHKSLLTSLCDDVKMAELAQMHRMKFAVARAPRLGYVRISPRDFERNASRFALGGLGKGARILIMAMVWALWLPMLLWLLGEQRRAAAAIFFFVPTVFLAPWYGAARALLAPFGIYTLLPTLVRGTTDALLHRRVEWKGRVI